MNKVKLSEKEFTLFKTMLVENQESDSQHKAISYLINTFYMSDNYANDYVRNEIRKIYHCLNGNPKAGKFTLGVVRIQKSENLDDEKSAILNEIIKIIANNDELYKKYDKNLNNMTMTSLENTFKETLEEIEQKEKETKAKNRENRGRYRIIAINSFNEAKYYQQYVSWCICEFPAAYKNYTRGGKSFIFLLRDDYKEFDYNSEDYITEKAPHDDYGLSMIAVSINENDKLVTSTSRYNHSIPKYGDKFLSVSELCDIVGMDWLEILDNAENRKINNSKLKPTNEDIKFIQKIQTDKEFNEQIRNVEKTERINTYEITKLSKHAVWINNCDTNLGVIYSLDTNSSSKWYHDISKVEATNGKHFVIKCSQDKKHSDIYSIEGDKIFETKEEYPNITSGNIYKLKGKTAFICSSEEAFIDEESEEEYDNLNLINSDGYGLDTLFDEQYNRIKSFYNKKYDDKDKVNELMSEQSLPKYNAIVNISIKNDMALLIASSNGMYGTEVFAFIVDLNEGVILGYSNEIMTDKIEDVNEDFLDTFVADFYKWNNFGCKNEDEYLQFLKNKVGL